MTDLKLPTNQNVDEWQVCLWNLPDEFLSRPQKLQFMLMLEGAFNAFDPFTVIADLLRNRDLWQGVVMDRGYIHPEAAERRMCRLTTDLIKLRDLPSGYWNVDTLFITTGKDSGARWEEVIKDWQADEIHWIEGRDVSDLLGASPAGEHWKILTVWWD